MKGRLGGVLAGLACVVLFFVIGLYALATMVAGGGAASGMTGAMLAAQTQPCPAPAGGSPVVPISTSKAPGQWNAAQKANAAAIVEQVKVDIAPQDQMQAAIIALSTAMQESTLTNIAYGDKAGPDSRGLFQQRAPWGPLADRMDPHKAAHMFLTGGQGGQNGLLDIKGWQSMPVWQAAQSVQVSAFPTAYAKWLSSATALARALLSAPPAGGAPAPSPSPSLSSVDLCGGGSGGGGQPAPVAPASAEIEKMLGYAKSILGTPYRYGGTVPPPNGPGVDCSGLLVWSWKMAGHPMRIRTAAQMWDTSTELQRGTEQRGDEVYSEFVGGSNPGHVMIVWDPKAGTVIEAPHTGDVVKFLHYTNLPGIRFARFKPQAFAGGK